MKRLLTTILISCICCYANAQYNSIDSLKHLLALSKSDTTSILLKAKLANSYLYYKPDSSLLLAKTALIFAEKIDFTKGEARCYKQIGDAEEQMGNYPAAMKAYLKHLKIAEQLNMQLEISQALINIGILYQDQDEYKQAINYTLKAKAVIDGMKNTDKIKGFELNKIVIFLNAGFYYYKIDQLDPALIYEQDAYELSLKIHNNDNLGSILQNLGLIQDKYNNHTLAITYYRMSAQSSASIKDYSTLTDTYMIMADFYKTQKSDSSIFYAKKALSTAQSVLYTKVILDASTLLAAIYETTDKKAAYDYLKIATIAKDSLFNQEKVKQLQNLKFEEQVREQEVAELKAQQEQEHKDNLQLSAIALFIPVFFLVLLFLSKVKIHHRIIEFMSVLSILFLFEFVTLLLHPLISKYTHHTPVIEFLGFVVVAAILVPMHHRFNHWLIQRLTDMRKWELHHHDHKEIKKVTEDE